MSNGLSQPYDYPVQSYTSAVILESPYNYGSIQIAPVPDFHGVAPPIMIAGVQWANSTIGYATGQIFNYSVYAWSPNDESFNAIPVLLEGPGTKTVRVWYENDLPVDGSNFAINIVAIAINNSGLSITSADLAELRLKPDELLKLKGIKITKGLKTK